MPKINLSKQFKYSPNGSDVVVYPIGQHEVDAECAEIAKKAGCCKVVRPTANKASRPTENKG